jgi:hypothetical protein
MMLLLSLWDLVELAAAVAAILAGVWILRRECRRSDERLLNKPSENRNW